MLLTPSKMQQSLFIVNQKIPKAVPMIWVHVSRQAQTISSLVKHGRVLDFLEGSSKGKTYMYFILLLILGWTVSGCHLKTHITIPQLNAANTGHAFPVMLALTAGLRPIPPSLFLCTANLAIASTTRAKTYMTICWLTELWMPRPKTA